LGSRRKTPGSSARSSAVSTPPKGIFSTVGLTTCCYVRSEEAWILDPDGVTWEAFHTTDALETFGVPANLSAPAASEKSEEKACCAKKGPS
jgi:hypothetical protein